MLVYLLASFPLQKNQQMSAFTSPNRNGGNNQLREESPSASHANPQPSGQSQPSPGCIRGRLPVNFDVIYEDASLLGSTFENYEGFGSFFSEDVEVLIAKSRADYRPPEGMPLFASLDFYLTQMSGGRGVPPAGSVSCPLGKVADVESCLTASPTAGNVNDAETATPCSVPDLQRLQHFAEIPSHPESPVNNAVGGSFQASATSTPHTFASIESICQRHCKYQDRKGSIYNAPCDPRWLREMRHLRVMPEFGCEFKSVFFVLGSEYTFINHGAFGGALKIGMDIKRRYEELAECQLLKYIDRFALPAIAHATRVVAERVLRCDPRDVVLTPNATYGLNVAVASLLKAPALPRASANFLTTLLLNQSTQAANTGATDASDGLMNVMPQLGRRETVVAYLDTEYLSVYKMLLERVDLMQAEEGRTKQAIDEVVFLAESRRQRNLPGGFSKEQQGSSLPHHFGVDDSGIKLHEIPFGKLFRRTNLMADDEALARHLLHAIPRNTTVLILDHVTSNSAMRLPVFSHIIPALRSRSGHTKYAQDAALQSHFLHGCETDIVDGDSEPLYFPYLEHIIVDGAHSPLQCHFDMDMGSLPLISQPSVYCGNFHKWFCSPKSAGFMWVRKDVKPLIRPLIVSHGAGVGLLSDFIWDGTRDLGAFLSLPALVEFWYDAVGIEKVHDYCNDLRTRAIAMFTTSFGTTDVPRNSGFMSLVELPPFFSKLSKKITTKYLQETLHARFNIEAPVKNIEGVLYLRCSFFVNNTLRDYERVRDAVLEIEDCIKATMARNFQEKYRTQLVCNGSSNTTSSTKCGLPQPPSTTTCDEVESVTGSKRGRSESMEHDCDGDTNPTNLSSPDLEHELHQTPPSHPGATPADINGTSFDSRSPFYSGVLHEDCASDTTSNPRRKKSRGEGGGKNPGRLSIIHPDSPSPTSSTHRVNSHSGRRRTEVILQKRISQPTTAVSSHKTDTANGNKTSPSTPPVPSHLPMYSNSNLVIPKAALRGQQVAMPTLRRSDGLYLAAVGNAKEGSTSFDMDAIYRAWSVEFGDPTGLYESSLSGSLATAYGRSESPAAAVVANSPTPPMPGAEQDESDKAKCNGCAVNSLGAAVRKTRKF